MTQPLFFINIIFSIDFEKKVFYNEENIIKGVSL